MPIGAFFLSKFFGLPDEIALGLILTGSAPGAMASNVMSYIAKADTAYSISLTTVSTLLCPVLTPGIILLLAGAQLDLKFLDMFLTLIQIVIVPLFLGFAIRHFLKENLQKVITIFPAISVTFIIFICSLVIALNRQYILMITAPVLLADIVLNLYGMSAGYGVGKLFKMETKRRRTLAIEIGMQNAGLGTVLALNLSKKSAVITEKVAIPTAIFVFVCIITASIMAEIWQRSLQGRK
jgi:BASS family bile acid:Na+ symporter